MELTLPSAILRFRQGIGRLIRSKNDIGELIILDSRILKKQYGKLFLSELPKDRFERENAVLRLMINCLQASGFITINLRKLTLDQSCYEKEL